MRGKVPGRAVKRNAAKPLKRDHARMQSHRTCRRRSSRSFAIGTDPVAGLLNLATVLAAWSCALVHMGARNLYSKIGDRDDGGMESRLMIFGATEYYRIT